MKNDLIEKAIDRLLGIQENSSDVVFFFIVRDREAYGESDVKRGKTSIQELERIRDERWDEKDISLLRSAFNSRDDIEQVISDLKEGQSSSCYDIQGTGYSGFGSTPSLARSAAREHYRFDRDGL